MAGVIERIETRWSVWIGMKDMKTPQSDFSMYGEIILPVEPGVYVWLSE